MMGGWLVRLKNEKAPDAHATKPTKPPQGDEKAGFVGFVAYPPASFQKIGAGDAVAAKPEAPAANDSATSDPAPPSDPDCWCWPHSPAMNTGEIDTFTARLARFTDKGLILADAEQQADLLMIRDRDGDDRRLCLECSHLQGWGPWRCGNWLPASVSREGLGIDLVRLIQRCGGFKVAAFSATNFQMISENLSAQGD